MTHRWPLLLAVLALTLGAIAPTKADDDEPVYLTRKLSEWLDLLAKGKDAKDRERGVFGVEGVGHSRSRKVVPALVAALREDADPGVRAKAARATGRACAKALAQAREDKKDELPKFDSAREALETALRTDKSDAVREASAAALGDMGSDARGAAGALGLALKDAHAGTVAAAASALRRMGRDAREAESPLLALLADAGADDEVRTDAARALGQILADVPAAMKVMTAALADDKVPAPKIDEKDKSKEEVERLRKEALEAAQMKRTLLRRAVAESLGKWGKDAADASPALALMLIDKNSSEELRFSAITALEQFGPAAKAAVPALVKATADEDRTVRILAMQSLGRLHEVLEENRRPAIEAMLEATKDSSAEVCVCAAESLAALSATGLGEEKAKVLKRLEEVVKREGRKAIREAAQAARDKIEGKKKE
jgi:HEAT repeat protein